MNQQINNPLLKFISRSVLLIWSVSVLYPLLWTLLDALKNNEQFF